MYSTTSCNCDCCLNSFQSLPFKLVHRCKLSNCITAHSFLLIIDILILSLDQFSSEGSAWHPADVSVLLPHCTTGPELEQSRTVFNRRYSTGKGEKERCCVQTHPVSFKSQFDMMTTINLISKDFSLKALKVFTQSHSLLTFVLNGRPSNCH